MIELDARQIRLQATAADKREAIRQVGQLLVESGCIEPGYIESMLGREAVANTYLGNGIAIPHGLPKDRDLIRRTGIAVVQVPAGMTWNPGETAHLIVGIAAKSDEHIQVLQRLTRVLGDKDEVARLTRTTDPRDIIEALTGERPAAPPPAGDATDYAYRFDAVIHNRTGFHARPATNFVDLARRFQSNIKVRYGDRAADGKSLISLLQLGVESGATVCVSAEGPDAPAALSVLQDAIASGLGDEGEEPQPAAPVGGKPAWTPQAAGTTIAGVTAAGGLAIGPTCRYQVQDIVVADQPADPTAAGFQLQDALDAARDELDHLYEEVKARLGAGKAAIFRVHAELLNDTALIQQTIERIYDGHSAAWAWQQSTNDRVHQMEQLDDPVLAGRAADLRDIGQRVLRHLVDVPAERKLTLAEPAILLADDLTPSDTATLDPHAILGFCTAKGGPTSHSAILARSLGIPAVVGAGDAILSVPDGTLSILDGNAGVLYLQPSAADVQAARDAQEALRQRQDAERAARFAPALTTDGYRVEVAANIGRPADALQAVEAGAEAVGLLRTEFLFLGRAAAPSEEEQFVAYRDMVQALDGRPLIIRTLDIGGDKAVPYLNLPKEDNPFLGVRGIRLCLARPDLFLPQLRAIYRAAAYGPVKIMFPMIATLEELTQARAIAERVRQELEAPPVDIGIMIEVPSAVVLADHFAQEIAFFSIGTNDLTQYVLAMDRLHPQLAKQADGLHPAVLRLVDRTVQAARSAGKWVGVCGGIAADPKGAVILAGLGVTELSVDAPSVATVKAQIRARSMAEMQRLAQAALQCRTAAAVRDLIDIQGSAGVAAPASPATEVHGQ